MANKIQSSGMTVELESPDDVLLVESYGDGGFRLLEKRVEGSIYVTGNGFFPLNVETFDALTVAHIDSVVEKHAVPEILIIGTGETMQLLPKNMREHMDRQGIGYDVMSTGAAARTYNVLKIEGRNVVALLVQVP